MKNFVEFRIETIPKNVDTVSGILWELDIAGITEIDNYLLVYTGEESGITEKEISEQLDKLVLNNMIESFNVYSEIIKNRNWNEEWESKINVIEIGDKIVIKPSFKKYEKKPGQIILYIDPKMSFGTGEHETTKLMIQMTEKYTRPGMKVLDVGTGTGVLAICAVKLGAAEATGIDNDEWCKINGEENVSRNQLTEKVKIEHCEIKDIKDNDFDLVVANINRNILLEIIPEISERVKKDGLVILSGLLIADEEIIKESCHRSSLNFIESQHMNEWTALVFNSSKL